MNYSITRHYQRYEHIVQQGYVTDKRVLEVGCGHGAGITILTYYATEVIGTDPCLKEFFINKTPYLIPGYMPPNRTQGKLDLKYLSWEQFVGAGIAVDVVVGVELIEHLQNPAEFLDFAADTGEYLFLTTPLAAETGPTDNELHVVEYSHNDLLELLSKRFNVITTKYQTGDLQIVDKASSNGSSINPNHVVQMVWCKCKEN